MNRPPRKWDVAFDKCVDGLHWTSNTLDPVFPGGMDYHKLNVILFVIVVPAVVVVLAGGLLCALVL